MPPAALEVVTTSSGSPAGGNLWRTQRYYPWTAQKNGGMLASLKVGYDEGTDERLSRGYVYNSFGEITALTEGADSYAFSYDGLGRLTSAYGRSYSYDGASRLSAFNGQAYGYGDSGPYHAVDRIAGADRFDYDANGNMVKRNKGLTDEQTLVWDDENRLEQVQDSNGATLEQYWYGAAGMRVKKTSGNTTTYSFFAQYEEEVTNGVTTAISYYTFGGLRIAVKRGNTLYHLHGDHLGSTSLTTRGSAETASRAYYAYGAERSATGDLKTDHTFTGQKRDATGLMYYNARYYDPALGTFVSPDSMVPGAGQVINYNRFLYARGNPFKYTDPSGYIPDKPTGPPPGVDKWVVDWYWNNRWYLAHGYGRGDGHWNVPITAEFLDKEILTDVLGKAGIEIDSAWKDLDPEYEDLSRLGQGVVKLAQKVGKLADTGTTAGLARLKTLAGGEVTWFRANVGGPGTTSLCTSDRITAQTPACARGARIEFYNVLFGSKDDALVGGTAVHELAHVINSQYCVPIVGTLCQKASLLLPGWDTKTDDPAVFLTKHAKINRSEYWAEVLAVWVYDDAYFPTQRRTGLDWLQEALIELVMQR